ncbi:FAD:protein FMN transferase [Akkermansiaceae bacterium]|nr:FAD:protein FMN transferase [Akkermansiaceae bacterium]MDB4272075.1 FAD:protein FMN transferase [bacterium]MDA7518538.1 FAD:protein FMN transferase [Akkermansiaceae bacterium]MDA7675109.1 FAD:protein FMN transferase [Akkermansiaceae bacterium]MDB4141838.1 FAD:protein FMN transferase [Akkermansiaceae bacterium]
MTAQELTAGLFKLRFKALGTNCVVQFRAPSIDSAKGFRTAALAWIREFENTWSRFRPDSLLCQINASAGKTAIQLTPEQDEVLRLCEHTYRTSREIIDPSSYPLTKLWDEGAQRDEIPSDQMIAQALGLVGWGKVEFSSGQVFLPEEGMALEIGGFGKEYAVDQLIALARSFEIKHALVDLGRDVATLGSPPHGPYWIVGAENAQELDAPLHRLAITNQALATSGNGRRFRSIAGDKFGHIIDARSGWPVKNNLLTATCLANDCLTAGLLSTSACILGAEAGMAEIDRSLHTEALFQTSTNTIFSRNIHLNLIAS